VGPQVVDLPLERPPPGVDLGDDGLTLDGFLGVVVEVDPARDDLICEARIGLCRRGL